MKKLVTTAAATLMLVSATAFGLPPQQNGGQSSQSSGPHGQAECADVNHQLVSWKIGIYAMETSSGIVVTRLTRLLDRDQHRFRSAAESIMVDFYGNGSLVPVRLDPGDTITMLNGQSVRTRSDLAVALNGAYNPRQIQIRFRDYRTGREYTGTMNAVRVR